jgi:hypothetical protein
VLVLPKSIKETCIQFFTESRLPSLAGIYRLKGASSAGIIVIDAFRQQTGNK